MTYFVLCSYLFICINYLGWGRESCLFLLSTRKYVVFVRRGFFFLLVLRIGCIFVALPVSYSAQLRILKSPVAC